MVGYLVHQLQTAFWTAFYYIFARLFFHELGTGCRFEGWIDMPHRGGKIVIGDEARISRFVEFSVPKGGVLNIGTRASIGRGTLIQAHQLVEIGSATMIAEYVLIHDNNHEFEDLNVPIPSQGYRRRPVRIGSGCWVGANTILLAGSGLGEKSVLGAGSILTRVLPELVIAVGTPAKVLRNRGHQQ